MRINEVLHLKWQDIDCDKGLITFTQSKTGKLITIPLSSWVFRHLVPKQSLGVPWSMEDLSDWKYHLCEPDSHTEVCIHAHKKEESLWVEGRGIIVRWCDEVTRHGRPFGVYDYGVLFRANRPFSAKHWHVSMSEIGKEIRLNHLWVMRLNIHHEGKRGHPYDQGRTYILDEIPER